MPFTASAVRSRLVSILTCEGTIQNQDTVERIGRLQDIESLGLYMRSVNWPNLPEREFSLMVIGTAVDMMATGGDDAGLRKAFTLLLAYTEPTYGFYHSVSLAHARRAVYKCLYQKHGLATARAFEHNSLADIRAFWPSYELDYPFHIEVFKK